MIRTIAFVCIGLSLWALAEEHVAPAIRRAYRRLTFRIKARQDDQRQRAAIRARREVANG